MAISENKVLISEMGRKFFHSHILLADRALIGSNTSFHLSGDFSLLLDLFLYRVDEGIVLLRFYLDDVSVKMDEQFLLGLEEVVAQMAFLKTHSSSSIRRIVLIEVDLFIAFRDLHCRLLCLTLRKRWRNYCTKAFNASKVVPTRDHSCSVFLVNLAVVALRDSVRHANLKVTLLAGVPVELGELLSTVRFLALLCSQGLESISSPFDF